MGMRYQMGVGGELVDSTRIYPKHWSPVHTVDYCSKCHVLCLVHLIRSMRITRSPL